MNNLEEERPEWIDPTQFTLSADDQYRANPLLKRAFTNIDFTPEMVQEFLKCQNDIAYFIRTYVKIISLDYGLINFNLYDFQEDIAKAIKDERFTIIKTPRQAGKTTTAAAVILWHALFKENYTVAILANKLATSREILSRVQRAFEYLPKWLQQGVVNWNKTSMELENGSQILAGSTSSSAIRGYSINFLYLDEFAFVGRNMQEDFFTSVYPTIISGKESKVVITSTPNGFDLFYKIWSDSVEGINEYKHIAVKWNDVPGRDEEWKRKTIANTSEAQFRQEFEAEFIGSSNTLISPETLRVLTFKKPIRTSFNDSLRIYKEPEKDSVYFCTVDTSRGVGIDASSYVIFDLTTYPFEVAAIYSNNQVDSLIFPEHIHQVVRTYNECPVLVEINDNGQQVADILYEELQYDGVVFTSMKKGRGGGPQLGGGHGNSLNRGVRTTKSVKSIGCSNVRTLIEQHQLVLHDFDLVREFSTFIVKGSSYGAEEGAHDDMVMCCVLLAWATDQEFFKELTNTNFRRALLEEREKMVYDDTMPFGFVITGDEDIDAFEEFTNW